MFLKVVKRVLPVLEALAHVAVVLGIVFVALEFVNQRNRDREMNSLEILKEFHAQHVADARRRLQSYWLEMPVGELSGLSGSAGVMEQLASNQIFSHPAGTGAQDLITVLESLDIVGMCITSDVCDPMILRSQLASYTSNILCLYKLPIFELRTSYSIPDLGVAAQAIINGRLSCSS